MIEKTNQLSIVVLMICMMGYFSGCSSTGETIATEVNNQEDTSEESMPQYIEGTVWERVINAERDTVRFVLPGALIRIFDSNYFQGNRSYSANREGEFRIPVEDLPLDESYTIEVMNGEGATGTIIADVDGDGVFSEYDQEIFLEETMNVVIGQNLRPTEDTSGPIDVELILGDPRRVRID